MLKIFTFPFIISKDHEPAGVLLKEAGKGEVCYVSPTERKAVSVKTAYPNAVTRSFNPTGLSDFLLKRAGSDRRFINEDYRSLLILDLVLSDEKLKKLFGTTAGTLSILSDFIGDMKFSLLHKNLAGLREKISSGLAGFESVRERALAAVDLLAAYENSLKAKNACDNIDKVLLAAEAVRMKGFPFKKVVLDGFYDLPKAQEELFSALIENTKEVLAGVYSAPGIPALRNSGNDFLEFLLRQKEVSRAERGFETPPRIKSGVKVAVALSVEDEVSGIARSIKHLEASKAAAYSELTVTFPSMYNYLPYVERIFKKFRIPYCASVERGLGAQTQAVPLTELLECILEDFPRRKTAGIVSSPVFGCFSGESKRLVSSASRNAGIIAGSAEWADIKERLKNDFTLAGFYESNREGLELLSREVNGFISFALKKEAELTLPEFVKYLRGLLEYLKYSPADRFTGEGVASVLEALKEYTEPFSGRKTDFPSLCRIFIGLLSGSSAIKDGPDSGVRVFGILETRGLYSKYVFFGGLNDGEYPVRPKQEMILPDRIRKELGLVTFEKRIELQRLHFFRLFEEAEKATLLSYPSQDRDRIFLPSNFIPEDAVKVRSHFDIGTSALNIEEEQKQSGLAKKQAKKSGEAGPVLEAGGACLKLINKKFGPEQSLSVTLLDRYLKCPYRFYLENIAGVEPLEEPGYEMDNAVYGSVMHDIMQSLFSPGRKTPGSLKEGLNKALAAAMEERRLTDFWKDYVREKALRVIEKISRQEETLYLEFPEIKWVEKKLSAEVVKGKLKLKGRVDRIDSGKISTLIIDYKTGSRAGSSLAGAVKLESLQLPLYAKMLKVSDPGIKDLKLGIYDLTAGKLKILDKEVEPLIEEAVAKAVQAVSSLRDGKFPKTEEKNCFGCSFAEICR
ncbi:MAG: PD-(D/E)XK nuclease family protein [Candidatus Firestonebacteria bacterium]